MHEYYSYPCHTLSVLLLASCMFDFEKIKIPKICMNVIEASVLLSVYNIYCLRDILQFYAQ